MVIRRKIIRECKGNPLMQKTVAMAIYIKFILGKTSNLPDYSVNKLHKITHIAPTSIKKYIPIMIKKGWAMIRNGSLTILCMRSHNTGRNINIDRFNFESFKETYRSLRAFIALSIQARKDYIRRTLLLVNNPKSAKENKVARKKVRSLVRRGFLDSLYQKYMEAGLSLKRIAKETGNCVRTAQRIMQYAIRQKWCKKQHHFLKFPAKKYFLEFIPSKHAFMSNGFVYIVQANTYTLSKGISKDISAADAIAW